MSYLNRMWVFVKFLWFSTFKIFSLKADQVLVTSTPLTIGIPALLKKWLQKTPFIFEVRDVWPEAVIAIGAIKNVVLQKLLFFLERLLYKNASAIVPLSTDMKYSIVSRYPELINKPVVVIENISEINRFQNNIQPDRCLIKEKIGFQPRFSILYAGTFGKVNGIDYVIHLAQQTLAIDPTLIYVLIGNGSQKDKIHQRAMEIGVLNKNVFFLKSVAKNDLPQLYYEANMGSSFVIDIKELWSNSANKFFDTLAAGKPILINHGGWQKDVIEKFNLGYVLPSEIDKEIVDDFVAYTKSRELQHLHQKNALAIATEFYSLDVAVEKYFKIFNKVKPCI